MGPIGVVADAHANLPASLTALYELERRGCETVIHIGDAIGIGPHPREVVSLLVEWQVVCLMGNHDEWFAFGLPKPRPRWMSEGEAEHHRWAHAQLSAKQRDLVRAWPHELVLRVGGKAVAFVHYARRAQGGFDHIADPTPADLGATL